MFLRQVRLAFRSLWRTPVFALAVGLTLALGIGANSAIFSVFDAVVFRPLPWNEAGRVVRIWGSDGDGRISVSERERERYREESRIFSDVAASYRGWVNLTGEGSAERLSADIVDVNLLSLLGARPELGRGFLAEEGIPGQDRAAILSDGLWRRRFGADPAVVGQRVLLDGSEYTIVGVLPAGFRTPSEFEGGRADLLLPLGVGQADPRNIHYMEAVARLAPGVTPAQAQARLDALGSQLRNEITTLPERFTIQAIPIREDLFGSLRPVLLALLGAVALVLLIACANVGNLFLARAEGRKREFAIRTAMGAGRRDLIRQLLIESLLLALVGAAVGLVLALGLLRGLAVLGTPALTRLGGFGINTRVLLYTGGLTLLTALAFGLLPALRLRPDPANALREGGRGNTGNRIGRGLVVAEVALGLTLAVGAGLVVKSFAAMVSVDPGFDPAHALTAEVTLPAAGYEDKEHARQFFADLLGRIRSLPGVEAAGAVTNLPMITTPGDWGVRIEGREAERLPSGRRPWADWHVATEGYFEAMGTPIVAGRDFDATDQAPGRPVVLINQTMARRYWPGESALGKRFKMSSTIDTVYRTVVGVVADIRQGGLDRAVEPEMFLPHAQFPATAGFPVGNMSLVIRTTGDPDGALTAVRQVLREVDPRVPLSRSQSLEDVLQVSTADRRLHVTVFGLFAILALVLVSIGVYGLMSYLVTRRTREIGVRLALGATRSEVVRHVLEGGLRTVGLGLGIGIIAAIGLTHLLASVLYQVSPLDAAVFLAAPLVVGLVAVVANLGPALRASRTDPVVALRSE